MKKLIKQKNTKLSLFLMGVIALFGFFLVRWLTVVPEVAQVSTGQSSCVSNVVSLSFTDECSPGKFKQATYKCKNGNSTEAYGNANCIDFNSIVKEAQNNCGMTCVSPTSYPSPSLLPHPSPVPTCVPRPACLNENPACKIALADGAVFCPASPTPSTIPTPKPTPQTSWGATCRVRVFKLNQSDDPAKPPMQYATPDREINPANNRVKAGDSYAYLLEVTTRDFPSSIATISAGTTNMHGFDEPILISSSSKYCSPESRSKYMSCNVRPGIDMPQPPNLKPTLIDIGMVATIQPEIQDKESTSIIFNPYFITSAGYGTSAQCTVMMYRDTASTPTPPSTPPGCYQKTEFCLGGLIGRQCPVTMVCPTPTPTPVPSRAPTGTPITSAPPSPDRTPIPPVTTCGTSLSKWNYKEQCSTNPRSYRYAEFTCAGDGTTRMIGSSSSCKPESVWLSEMRNVCATLTCEAPTPTIVAEPKPIPSPTPRSRCLRLFGRSFCLPTPRR